MNALFIIDHLGTIETCGGDIREVLGDIYITVDTKERFAALVESLVMVVQMMDYTILDTNGLEKFLWRNYATSFRKMVSASSLKWIS